MRASAAHTWGERMKRPAKDSMLVLALNVGSSSLKAAVFDVAGDEPRMDGASLVFAATVATSDGRAIATVRGGSMGSPQEELFQVVGSDGRTGIEWLLDRLERAQLSRQLAAVGHRVVHGGTRFREPIWLDRSTLADLRSLVDIAPDHLPSELAAIDVVAERLPQLRQAACFDTAFHRTLPTRARLFGLPRAITDEGVLRYGFHGLSFEYIVETLRAAGTLVPRLVVAHLGGGASLCAILDGQSIDTTMGFTPAGGIVMATRSGDLDPGVMLYLLRTRHLDAAGLNRAVNVDGGLAGISGGTGDMRTLLDRSTLDPRAADAVDVFCYQVRKAIAAYAAALSGLDSLVFTAGIGEHSAIVRARACEGLEWCGVTIDPARNAVNAPIISPPGSRVTVRVLPTNEELMIARHVRALPVA